MSEETEILVRASNGDPDAQADLYRLVRAVLGQIARGQLRVYGRGVITQTTVLVDDAFFRLMGTREITWKGLAHFYALAKRVIKERALDHRRRRLASRRGGGRPQATLDEIPEAAGDGPNLAEIERLEALSEALAELAEQDELLARVVELHTFRHLSFAQVAEELGIPETTLKRRFGEAQARLLLAMRRRGFRE